jgi:formylglycine-generating enzyme required for sulfatase activity
MIGVRVCFLFLVSAFYLFGSAANAEKRVALIIGNSAYTNAGELKNPKNDATDLAAALKSLSFDVVLATDLNKRDFDEKIRDFTKMLASADVGVFFYAGHGLQANGLNYLIATDAKLEAERDLDWETIRLDLLLAQMEREVKTNIIFLDACRNNPFAGKLARTMSRGPSPSGGLATVTSGVGTFISFATAPGRVASDGAAHNSPFSAALKKHVLEPGLSINDLMIEVRKEVYSATNGNQVPWDHSALLGRFYFNEGTATASAAAPKPEVKVALQSATNPSTVARGIPEDQAAAKALAVNAELALEPGKAFKECPTCPEMVVVPPGSFVMGSTKEEVGRFPDEGPQRKVTISQQFAVARFAVSFEEWDACLADKGCNGFAPATKLGSQGKQPVTGISWPDAKAYAAWLSSKTGKSYRLLAEAEREYVARAGSTTTYWWGDEIGKGSANCDGCGSIWDGKQSAPVGSFRPNAFGLHDLHGNVWEWVEDCYEGNYQGSPNDGSARTTGNCVSRVLRGGAFNTPPRSLRSANRGRFRSDVRFLDIGFRLARAMSQ